MGDGEDFELLFSVKPQAAARLEQEWPEAFPRLSRIGELTESGGLLEGGWGHFESR